MRNRWAKSALAALFAVGIVVGFSFALTSGATTKASRSASPATTAPRAHLITTPPTTPPAPVHVPSPPPAPVTTTPAPPTAPAAASSPGPCTPNEVSITTVTNSANYAPGQPVTVTTELQADTACSLVPVESGQYACGATAVVVNAANDQVWPMPGQAETCAAPAPQVLSAGNGVEVAVAWNQEFLNPATHSPGQAPPGLYAAVGAWSWSAGPGQAPYTVAVESSQFAIE